MSAKILKTRTERVSRLTAADREAMFELLEEYYTEVTREQFEADLAGKQFLIRMFGAEGALAGFSTIQLIHTQHGRSKLTTVFSGDTVIAREYWGQKQLQRAFTAFLLRTRLRYPFRRVVWFLISKGYKTYLLMRNNLTCFPNYEQPTPPEFKRVLDHVARLKYPERYDAEAGIIRYPRGSAVKPEVACLDEAADDPDIRFFLEANPGWDHGDELCCLAEVRINQVVGSALKYAVRRKRTRRQAREESATPSS